QDRFELNRANFFVSNASKVRRSGSTVGVFSLPRPQDLRLFEGFAEQLEHFESAGLVSRELSGQGPSVAPRRGPQTRGSMVPRSGTESAV
ncbi:MAG: hypothetical protein GX593_10110, partial [Actinomycetales bacterium]|nr:hypothetical protein [Actinomycetales bacterium]